MASSRSIWPVMSRFARPHHGQIRTWAPPKSPLRIEYSSELLREIRLAGATLDTFGPLYGVRQGNTVRLTATRGRAGLEPVGVFASRVRGHVFLTEADLGRFEKADASVALVISGERAGFFVRDQKGSIETVRSYEEFSIHEAEKTKPFVKRPRWHWAACLALLPLFFFLPHKTAPALALELREDAGQLHISWNIPTDAKLTIIDGDHRASVPITRDQTSATYARVTGDVTVQIGSLQARFVGPAPGSSEVDQTRRRIADLRSRVASLRAFRRAREKKIASLQRRLLQ